MLRVAPLALVLSLLAPLGPGDAAVVGIPRARHGAAPPAIVANANRVPAGRLLRGVLTVHLVARLGRWFPEEEMGAGLDIEAFAEEGGPLRNPGPLIRVPEGTEIRASVRNALAGETLVVHGLLTRPATADDTIQVPPGATRTVRFLAGAPGTYLYWATTAGGRTIADRRGRDSQLSGAFVVDARGRRPDERVFVISVFEDTLVVAGVRDDYEVVAINGLSYPHTEPLAFVVGDSVRWRWINASDRQHPMHLHGFYFRVDARGDAGRDTAYAPDGRRLAVTERMEAGTTMRVVWSPDRPGTWVFHCHILYHIAPGLHLPRFPSDTTPHGAHMAGLLLAMQVRPAPGGSPAAPPADTQQVRLLVQARPHVYGADPGFGYVVQSGGSVPPDSVSIPGAPIVLTRGRLARVTVVNHLPEPTSVHWHGLELQSYFDGVAGLSGTAVRRAPLVAPGDSFVAEMTPPRAGTFIYHTHVDDVRQMSLGLYGPLLVLDPGERYDPRTDHVVFVSLGGLGDSVHLLVNGSREPVPIGMRAGVPQRLRFILMAAFGAGTFRLMRDSTLERWRPVGKDGADLAPSQRGEAPAAVTLSVGEAYDFDYTPAAGAALRLELWSLDGRTKYATVPVRVD
jgi:FtsP/CotA-like multicopper oxidase with cupredoxin domain